MSKFIITEKQLDSILGYVKTIKRDCLSQSDSLEATNEPCWDVDDIENWKAMAESMDEVEQTIREVRDVTT